MQIKQVGSLRRSAQAGFTLIELIVVIVILGILAATALPRFANMGGEARIAKMRAAMAAISSASAMYHGKWLAAGSNTTSATVLDGININTAGFPTAADIGTAAGLGTDYVNTAGVITPDANHTGCIITYTANTGVVVATALTETVCN